MKGDPNSASTAFEAARPRLTGLAYRMIGSLSDAEDVVQEAWLRWNAVDQGEIARPDAWFTTVTTRLALDRLKKLRRRREDYVGPWLPEPVATSPTPEETAELADSLTLGFLTLLDTLSPVERAVFVLSQVFCLPFADIADAVGKSEAACRQIASRSRRRLTVADRRPTAGERELVDALIAAVSVGDLDAVLARLAPDVVCLSDGGPDRRGARRPIVGADRVARFFINLARRATPNSTFVPMTVNGEPGLVGYIGDRVDFVGAFEIVDGRAAAIRIVRNPDKLAHFSGPPDLV